MALMKTLGVLALIALVFFAFFSLVGFLVSTVWLIIKIVVFFLLSVAVYKYFQRKQVH